MRPPAVNKQSPAVDFLFTREEALISPGSENTAQHDEGEASFALGGEATLAQGFPRQRHSSFPLQGGGTEVIISLWGNNVYCSFYGKRG